MPEASICACARYVLAPKTIRCVSLYNARRWSEKLGALLAPVAAPVAVTILSCPFVRQNLKRVRPPGSAPNTTVAERGSMRYTFHGGGPCDGALNGAVMPDPL